MKHIRKKLIKGGRLLHFVTQVSTLKNVFILKIQQIFTFWLYYQNAKISPLWLIFFISGTTTKSSTLKCNIKKHIPLSSPTPGPNTLPHIKLNKTFNWWLFMKRLFLLSSQKVDNLEMHVFCLKTATIYLGEQCEPSQTV